MEKAKFEIKDMLTIGLVFVVTGIALAYGLQVTSEVQDDMDAGSYEDNATTDVITGVAKIPEKMPLIATVVVAAIIIGIILRYLVFR